MRNRGKSKGGIAEVAFLLSIIALPIGIIGWGSPGLKVVSNLQFEYGYFWVVVPKGNIVSTHAIIDFFPLFGNCHLSVPSNCAEPSRIPQMNVWVAGWNASLAGNIMNPNPVGATVQYVNVPQNRTIWTSMPNATTELFGLTNDRLAYNWTAVSLVSISANILLASSSKVPAQLRPQISINNGATWNELCVFNDCGIHIFLNQTGIISSKWFFASLLGSITLCCNLPVALRIVGQNGNNTRVDIGSVTIRFAVNIGSPQSTVIVNSGQTDLDAQHFEEVISMPAALNVALNVTVGWAAWLSDNRFTPFTANCSNPTLRVGTTTIAPFWDCPGRSGAT